jgi:hypothetical protein
MPQKRPSINMHNLSFGGGFMGLVFAAGSALIFLLGFPTLWYFVALAVVLGIGIAALLRVLNQDRANRRKPLSILAAPMPESSQSREKIKWHRSFRMAHP